MWLSSFKKVCWGVTRVPVQRQLQSYLSVHTLPWLKGQNKKRKIRLNIHFLLLPRSRRTLSCTQGSRSWVREGRQQVSYRCGDGSWKGQTVLGVSPNPQGVKGNKKCVMNNFRKKEKTWGIPLSCLQSNANSQTCWCVSPEWLHAVSLFSFDRSGLYKYVSCEWESCEYSTRERTLFLQLKWVRPHTHEPCRSISRLPRHQSPTARDYCTLRGAWVAATEAGQWEWD